MFAPEWYCLNPTLNKLGAAATGVRRQWVTTLLARKTLPKGAATFVADCLVRDSYILTQHDGPATAAELLGIDAAAIHNAGQRPAGRQRQPRLSGCARKFVGGQVQAVGSPR